MSRTARCAARLAAVCFLGAGAAFAHPPGADGRHDDGNAGSPHAAPFSNRTWTNARTGEVVRGAFLSARMVDGVMNVSIERDNGQVVSFALADLSETDRVEAQRRIDAIRAINGGSAPAASAAKPSAGATPDPRQPSDPAPSAGQARYTTAWVTRAVAAPRVRFHTFRSAAAGGDVSFHLYTPAEYDNPGTPDRRFPVVYWLHGSGGGLPGIPTVAANFDAAIRAGKMPPALVVFVNGLVEGMYVDWKDGSTPVESVIIRDLVPHVDASFRTVSSRQGRVIDGFSMGGYGAARLGFKHTALFRAVSMMGAGPLQAELVQAPRAGRQRAAEVLAKVYGDQAYFRAVSPRRLAQENAPAIKAGSLVRIVAGDRDETFAENRAFHDHLAALGIPHQWKVLAGVAHDPAATFEALGDDMWSFYREALAAPPATDAATSAPPPQAAPFNAFAPFVATRWDARWLYVESDGLPHVPGGPPGGWAFSHPLMVGITAWQQQVPLPQSYRGSNAWQIPLTPRLAEKPVSAKEQLFRGAIALAANGVPIFNPIKNDGRTDTFLAGELDEFGGHCGRADDYHYHVAPTHLQKFVGAGSPIAYALDGFPIYGLFDPAARPGGPDADRCCPLGSREPLDWMNGHHAPAPAGSPPGTAGPYHYHASAKYPYLNGGMRGVVTVKDDQIDPQPRASSPRAALPPLRGATITGFRATGKAEDPAWSLEYSLAGNKHFVNYRLVGGAWIFDFVDPTGATRTDRYDAAGPQRRQGGGGAERGRRPREQGDRPPAPAREDRPAPPSGGDQPEGQRPKQPAEAPISRPLEGFALASSDVTQGRLVVDCTCDGTGRSPSLAWSGAPKDARAFAVVMHHVPPDGDTHVYMIVANIPSSGGAGKLPGGDTRTGVRGQNTVNRRAEYAPPCSKGPGDKAYTITLYALSAVATLPKDKPLTRDALLSAINDTTVATATLNVKYARQDASDGKTR